MWKKVGEEVFVWKKKFKQLTEPLSNSPHYIIAIRGRSRQEGQFSNRKVGAPLRAIFHIVSAGPSYPMVPTCNMH